VSGGHAHDLHGVPVESPVQRLDASVKVACLLGFVLAVVATRPQAMVAFAGYAALVAVAVVAARLPVRVLLRRMAIELPFVAFAFALPFIGTGERTDVAGVSLSIAGLWGAWSILAKASLGVAATVVLSWSTPVADVLTGLDRLGMPRVIVVIAGFMVRYLHVLGGELGRLQVARVSRGDDPRWPWQGKAVAATAGTLFVRSYERGERVQQAMVARGFTGRFPTTTVAGPRAWFPALLWPAAAWAVAAGAWLR
jgi:cobalt/nickel transport system permease protein